MSIHRGTRLLQISLVVKTNLLQTATKLVKTPLPISLRPPPTNTTRQVASTPCVYALFFPSKQRAEWPLKLGCDQSVPRLFHFIIRESRLNGQEIYLL